MDDEADVMKVAELRQFCRSCRCKELLPRYWASLKEKVKEKKLCFFAFSYSR